MREIVGGGGRVERTAGKIGDRKAFKGREGIRADAADEHSTRLP